MTGLLPLLDDIASTLDDISVMTKVAMRKTSALMTDDLAVNAGVLEGAGPTREMPLVWKIFVGSLVNKVIAISLVLLIMKVYPPLISLFLAIGGLYLGYEGAHKILEKLSSKKKQKGKLVRKTFDEKKKVWGAIKTDLILSLEIIVIANSSIETSFYIRSFTLIAVGLGASLIIYGLVAFILKIDDFGLWLISKGHEKVGLGLVKSMPIFMKVLGMVGTVAMLLVAGGIVVHLFHLPYYLPEIIQNLFLGSTTGLIVVGLIELFHQIRAKSPHIP